ncbi:DUF4136 domain-containing protein [Photobacterium sanguinicancri]|uniref:DUF4136 domain-containing protein n=1 Tax=Photobacterium sanguinicancri TaxID=875932 RepID=UPI0026E46ABA|nr:DUF4136 domain-containing protein [Photobacterium sanguinicancri]MDO6498027.1 DUF4136 domain-containing protein [Photobacterium sanguinicancri]
MNNVLSCVFCCALLGSLIACTADVSTDYDKQTNYAQFKTYQFAVQPDDDSTSLDAVRVENAITRELQTHGLTLSKDKAADVTIRHAIQSQSDYQSSGTSFGFGYGFNNVGIGVSTPTQYKEYKYGKLIVEMVATNNNQVVWRSVSQRKLKETMSPDDRETFIDEQIGKMFKNYPPQ